MLRNKKVKKIIHKWPSAKIPTLPSSTGTYVLASKRITSSLMETRNLHC